MKRTSFKKGSLIKYLGKLCRVVKPYSATEVLIEDLSTKTQEIALIADTKSPDEDTPNAPIKALDTLTAKDRAEAERRRKIIDPILQAGGGRTALTKTVAKENGVGVSTLRRWVKLFEGRRLLCDLAPKRKGRKMPDQLKKKQEALIQKVIEDHCLTLKNLKITHVHHHLDRLCRAAKVKTPHISTLRRRIDRLPERLKTKRRLGAQEARHRHDLVKGSFPNADYPLSHVQIDHTELDIIIVDDKDRLPVGRVWITVAIDVYSRMVTGFYLSLDAPSALSVGMCIVHSIQDKDADLAGKNIDGNWPVWGVMDTIHADNGSDFRSDTIAGSCAQYGINIEWRPVARPQYGGHIERFINTLNSEIHALPGTTYSNVQKRGKKNPNKDAEMTFNYLEGFLYDFIVRVYHNDLHRELGMSPLEKWEEGIKKVGHRDKITDTKRLYRDFLPSIKRKLQREGITWDGIWYRGAALEPWISSLRYGRGSDFTIRRDPRDISNIYFFDPKLNDYSVINWTAISELPMSIWELRAAKKKAKELGKGLRGQEAAFLGRKSMHERAEKAHVETKTIRKENAKRAVRKAGLEKVGALPPPTTSSLPTTPPLSNAGGLRIVDQSFPPTQDDDDEEFTYTEEELKPNWRKWT